MNVQIIHEFMTETGNISKHVRRHETSYCNAACNGTQYDDVVKNEIE